ncbi:MAG: GspE/PulE family protein [Candidatus Omnitrophota bacterium]
MAKYLEVNLKTETLNPQIVMMIPEDAARRYKVIAVRIEGASLCVAMADPSNLPVRDEIKLIAGSAIKPLKAPEKDITQAINQYYKIEEISKQALIDMRLEKMKERKIKRENITPIDEMTQKAGDMPVVKLVDDIIAGGINAKASDIHLEPQKPEMVVRYRVDGVLRDILTVPKHIEPQVISRIKILSNIDITERRRPQDGHIVLKREDKEYDFRISTLRTIGGEKIVMRIFDKSAMLISLEQLGLTKPDEDRFKDLIKKPHGMILVTGPTGSGKTTTLYAVLQMLNSKEKNILTVENPVEYKLDRINQIQIDEGIKMTFAASLRTILRQDPDIIMVGEIRDKETAETAIQAALTGHLVFSTLHTNDAPSAVTRLVDMGVEPFLIASTVIGCLAQRLCRTICSECKGKGCGFCYGTGYKGRTGIFELMKVNEEIRSAILDRKAPSVIKKIAVKEGMKTLEENGKAKVESGISTLEEVERVVYSGG